MYNYTNNGNEWFKTEQYEPDIVWLMKFAATTYYQFATETLPYELNTLGFNWDAAAKGHLDMQIKEQLAYFVYIYPHISEWVPVDMYETIRDLTIEQWSLPVSGAHWYSSKGENHNLFETQTLYGSQNSSTKSIKGALPVGHSITPNLMMYEVILRDGLNENDNANNKHADSYLNSAIDNTNWIIENLDITAIENSKGQRMSEHVVIENLTYIYEKYPEKVPELYDMFVDWGNTMVARADNMWNMRMASSINAGDAVDFWTGGYWAFDKGYYSTVMNEPGNIAGLQSCALAIANLLDESNYALIDGLETIGISAIDDVFGRNPRGRTMIYDGREGVAGSTVGDNAIEGVDIGWDEFHAGGFGHLEEAPFRLDASSKEYSYIPNGYNPGASGGYHEGWVQYNVAWNTSLAYSAGSEIEIDTKINDDVVTISLRAPLSMNENVAENLTVEVVNLETLEVTQVVLTEKSANNYYFEGTVTGLSSGNYEVSYGYDIFKNTNNFIIKGSDYVPVTDIKAETTSIEVRNGDYSQYPNIVISPSNATIKDIVWSSSDACALRIMDNGLIAIKEGDYVLTATSKENSEISTDINVKINSPEIININLKKLDDKNPNDVSKVEIESFTLSNGNIVAYDSSKVEKIEYVSDDRNIATVDDFGNVKYRRFGNTRIHVTAVINGVEFKDSLRVTVKKELQNLSNTSFTKNDNEISDAISKSVDWNGDYKYLNDTAYGGESILFVKPTVIGNFVEIEFNVESSELYKIDLRTKKLNGMYQHGEWKFFIDDEAVKLTTIDLGANEQSYAFINLGEVELTQGKHTLKLVANKLISGKCPGAFSQLQVYSMLDELVNISVVDNAIIAIKSFVNLEEYRTPEQASIVNIIATANDAINSEISVDSINIIVERAKVEMNAVKTNLALTKDEANLNFVTSENVLLQHLLDELKLKIDNTESISEVEEVVALSVVIASAKTAEVIENSAVISIDGSDVLFTTPEGVNSVMFINEITLAQKSYMETAMPEGFTATESVYTIKTFRTPIDVENGSVKIEIPFEGQLNYEYKLSHVKEDGSCEFIDATYKNNKLSFEALTFSPFMVIEKENAPSGGGSSIGSISSEKIFWRSVETQLELTNTNPVIVNAVKYDEIPADTLKSQQGTDKDMTVKLSNGEFVITNEMAKGATYSKDSYTIKELKAMFEVKPEPEVTPEPTVKPTEPTAPESGNMMWLWITLGVLVVGGVVTTIVMKRKNK